MFPTAASLNPAGWAHLFLFGVLLPIMVLINRKQAVGAAGPLPNRLLHFRRTVAEGLMLATASLVVAPVQGIHLFPAHLPPLRAWGAGLAAYAAAVVFMRPRWRRAVERRARVVHLFMPSTSAERIWWILVAVVAGIGEEITWRGVQLALVGVLTGSYWPAALVCSISFGLVHLVQGWKSAGVIVAFALGFHLLVWLGGSLYVAMAVHIAYDITAGINYGKLGRQIGFSSASREAERPVAG